MKELPKMYHSNIRKNISNRQEVYTSLEKEDLEEVRNRDKNLDDKLLIRQKIYDIFNAKDYIYKVDVTIVLDGETVNKRIVGKNRDNLITIDNEYIPIDSIRDIYRKNS